MSCCSDATLDKSLQIISHLDDDTLGLSGMKNNFCCHPTESKMVTIYETKICKLHLI